MNTDNKRLIDALFQLPYDQYVEFAQLHAREPYGLCRSEIDRLNEYRRTIAAMAAAN